MAAVVSQCSQLTAGRPLMPAHKTGTSFLASSHFTTNQDPSITASSLRSIFKQDYPAWAGSSRQPAVEPPCPAQVLHRDDRFFAGHGSETSKAFQFRAAGKLARPDMTEAAVKLRATNFKMDKDLSKFDSYQTSHMRDFYAKESQGVPKSMPRDNPMESFIPQGDVLKAAEPMSDYKHRYQGHDALSTKPERAACLHQVGPPTIKGDGRLNHFDTTHSHQFQAVSLPRIAAFPAPTGTNVPQGDKEKEATFQTLHQKSYQGHEAGLQASYDKASSGRTNFRLTDGHGAFDTYQSTARESYKAVHSTPHRSVPAHYRNHSDVPGGDLDPSRVLERTDMTTTRQFHDRKAKYGPVDIVSGANRRTASNVWFGEPTGEKYESTTSSVYKPASAPYKLPSSDMPTRSSVPMNYYADQQNIATTWSDFQNPGPGKALMQDRDLEKLKKVHIDAPLGGERQFSTEHLEQFVPKASQRVPIDSRRNQRSTVPLGTLTTH